VPHRAQTEVCAIEVLLEAADPYARGGGFAEVQGAIRRAEGERLVIFASSDRELRARVEMETVEEF
jgi:hypothetical protein